MSVGSVGAAAIPPTSYQSAATGAAKAAPKPATPAPPPPVAPTDSDGDHDGTVGKQVNILA